ncbi:uncharacterized protein TNCV_2577701 [Trichonephila clavipes]|nr:uncharacterized protein TNCV_2577701 [Trichonephila clavipes]
MQRIDLKRKLFGVEILTELKSKLEEMEVQKCVYVTQQKLTALKEMPRVEALIFEAWNSLPDCYSEVKKLFGVLTIFGSTYSCEQAFSCGNIIKSKWLATLTAMPMGLGSNPGEDMDVCKCIVTLNSHRATSPLVWWVERTERWKAPVFLPHNWGGTEQNRTVTCRVLKAAANDSCPQGIRSDFVGH